MPEAAGMPTIDDAPCRNLDSSLFPLAASAAPLPRGGSAWVQEWTHGSPAGRLVRTPGGLRQWRTLRVGGSGIRSDVARDHRAGCDRLHRCVTRKNDGRGKRRAGEREDPLQHGSAPSGIPKVDTRMSTRSQMRPARNLREFRVENTPTRGLENRNEWLQDSRRAIPTVPRIRPGRWPAIASVPSHELTTRWPTCGRTEDHSGAVVCERSETWVAVHTLRSMIIDL
jgi:hypothetical protein